MIVRKHNSQEAQCKHPCEQCAHFALCTVGGQSAGGVLFCRRSGEPEVSVDLRRPYLRRFLVPRPDSENQRTCVGASQTRCLILLGYLLHGSTVLDNDKIADYMIRCPVQSKTDIYKLYDLHLFIVMVLTTPASWCV